MIYRNGIAILDMLTATTTKAILAGNVTAVGSLTSCSSNGTTTITKAAHGLTLANGELVHITSCTTAADKGFYRITSSTGGTIVVDRALSGTDADVALTVYKDILIIQATDATNGQFIGNFSAQNKPLQIGGHTYVSTSDLTSEDIVIGGEVKFVANAYIGDSANAKSTLGLTINQSTNDDEIISLKSSDVGHTVTDDTETDTYGLIKKYSATAGGLLIRGLTDSDAAGALVLEGIIGATDPTDTNSAVILIGSKQSANTTAALGAAETVFQLKNRTTNLITVLGDGSQTQPASTYHNFGATIGTTGYGFHDNGGKLEWRPSGGIWHRLETLQAYGTTSASGADNLPFGDQKSHYIDVTNDANYNAFPGMARAANGNLILAYRQGAQHNTFDGSIKYKISTDNGATWGSEQTLYSVEATKDGRDPGVLKMTNGNLLASFFKRTDGGVPGSQTFIYRSTDNGANWSSLSQISSTTWDSSNASSGLPFQLANGNILLGTYSRRTGDTHPSAVVFISTDNGATWDNGNLIADGEADVKDYTEPNFVLLSDGVTIGCLIRNETDGVMSFTTSANGGSTWGALVNKYTADNNNRVIKLQNNSLVAVTRWSAGAANYIQLRMSTDDGVTWTADADTPILDTNTGFTGMLAASMVEVAPNMIAMAYALEAAADNADVRLKYLTLGGGIDPIGGLHGKSLTITDGNAVVVDGTIRLLSNTQDRIRGYLSSDNGNFTLSNGANSDRIRLNAAGNSYIQTPSDASYHSLIVGGATPSTRYSSDIYLPGAFEVGLYINKTAGASYIRMESQHTSPGNFIDAYSSRGTLASPSATQANDPIFGWLGKGYGDNAYSSTAKALIAAYAANNFTNASQGTYISFGTTPTGSVTRSERYRIGNDGVHHFWLTPTDGTNYEGISITPASGNMTIAAETAGTGADNINITVTPAGTGSVILNNSTYSRSPQIDGHTTDTVLTAQQVSNTIVYNTGQGANDVNLTLPAPAAGYSFIMAVGEPSANYWRLTAPVAGTLTVDGVYGKDYAQFSTPGADNFITVFTRYGITTQYGILTSATLAIGGVTTKVSNAAFTYFIVGVKYAKAGADTILAAGTIPQNKWGIYRHSIDAAGTITSTAGAANFTTGYDDEAAAIAALPALPASSADMGYVTVMSTDAGGFIGGTSNLNDGPVTDNYYSTAVYSPGYSWVVQTGAGTVTTN